MLLLMLIICHTFDEKIPPLKFLSITLNIRPISNGYFPKWAFANLVTKDSNEGKNYIADSLWELRKVIVRKTIMGKLSISFKKYWNTASQTIWRTMHLYY